MLSVVMYFIGGLLISLSAATIFVLAFETPFTRVEKILVKSILFSFSQHITQEFDMQTLSFLQYKWHIWLNRSKKAVLAVVQCLARSLFALSY